MTIRLSGSNFNYVKSHLFLAINNTSVVVKILSCLVIVGYCLSFMTSAIPSLTITPRMVMPPNTRIYSYFIFCFIEEHLWHVAADIAVIVLFGKLLEPLWGALETLLFFVIVNCGVGVTTSISYLVAYIATLDENFLFGVHVYGMAGYIAAFCVAVKQVMPDHCVIFTPFGKLRNSHIPVALLVIVIICRLMNVLPGTYPHMFGWGIIISWIYLRFYQKHGNGNRGDMAENFSFASFFPKHLRPMIEFISTTVFSCLVKTRVCRKPERHYDVSSPNTITVTLPGADFRDAERRKQLALKALNDRLNKTDSAPAWPSLDDNVQDDDTPIHALPACVQPSIHHLPSTTGPSSVTVPSNGRQILKPVDSGLS